MGKKTKTKGKSKTKTGSAKAVKPRGLSKYRILRVAARLADKEGIEALTMRRLGKQLDVEAMSLYNHFQNKEAILDGLVEVVVREIEFPCHEGDWKTTMRGRAVSAHEVLMQHPWATMLIVSRVNVGPEMLRYVDTTIGCLRAAGFSWKLADHAWNAIDSYIYGFTLHKLNFPFEPDEYAEVAKAFLPQISAQQYPHLVGLSHEVIDGRHDGIHDLQFGLELILDGLDRLK